MNVILPQRTEGQIGMTGASGDSRDGHPVLWLLHGLSDDHTIWMRRTSIERYVAPYGLAVVMPAVHRSYYTDMRHGYPYWMFVSEELPAIARQFFRLSPRREDNFVAGLSMGGYGALKLALRHPTRYAAAASLSGALDVAGMVRQRGDERLLEFENVYGDLDQIAGSNDDLLALAEKVGPTGKCPPFFLCCGTDDWLIASNRHFRDHVNAQGIVNVYQEHDGYGHTWAYWDKMIEEVLAWLPLEKPTE